MVISQCRLSRGLRSSGSKYQRLAITAICEESTGMVTGLRGCACVSAGVGVRGRGRVNGIAPVLRSNGVTLG